MDKLMDMDANKIDQHLNAVLRAAGSALRHYSLPKSLDDMRAAMKAAIDDATSDLQARVAELEAERAERAAQKPVAQVDDDECFQGPCRHATAFIPMHRGTLLYAEPPVTDLGKITVTTNESGRAVAVTRQDAEHRILSVIWEAPPATITPEQAEKADEAIREALGGTYDCMRVWSAWGVGTMGPGDFWPVADSDERVAEIRNAAAAALGFEVGK